MKQRAAPSSMAQTNYRRQQNQGAVSRHDSPRWYKIELMAVKKNSETISTLPFRVITVSLATILIVLNSWLRSLAVLCATRKELCFVVDDEPVACAWALYLLWSAGSPKFVLIPPQDTLSRF